MGTGKTVRKSRKKPDCEQCPLMKGTRPADTPVLVDKVLEEIEAKIQGGTYKATVGDYLRLLQFRQESKKESQPKEIKVTWVEQEEKSETEE